jgi:predicted Zn-dependent peptidase
MISEPGCQVVKMIALFPVGRNIESKRGLVQSVASLMKKETQNKSNKQLHELLDRYSIQIEVYSTPTHLTAQLHCHYQFIAKAIPLFFEILFQAKFSKKNWLLMQRQTIDSIEQQMMQTDFWADKLLSEHLLGSDHPYGYYSTPQDYKAINLLEIQEFYQSCVVNQLPEFFIAGDGVSLVKKMIGIELKKLKFSIKKSFTRTSLPKNTAMVLEKKIQGSSQASVRLGKVVKRDSFNDFAKLELHYMFLGGYYMSELMKLLRVDMGVTYGVYTHINHFPEFSVFNIGFETDKKNVPVALEAISRLFYRLKQEGNLTMMDAAREYYSQWSKNSEKSLQEIMYKVKMYKLGYDFDEYSQWVHSLINVSKSKKIKADSAIFDFSTYSKAIVY